VAKKCLAEWLPSYSDARTEDRLTFGLRSTRKALLSLGVELCRGGRNTFGEVTMSTESNKGIVRRYFEEVVDKRKLDILNEIATTDCIIHRPEASEPIRGLEAFKHALERILQVYSQFTTTIHDLIAEDDRVACRLSHRAVNRGEWTSRIGRHAVAGKTVSWPAIAIFRIRDGKIAEEWVNRDELGMLIDLGIVISAEKSK
jgi:predicted ester cyclase